jgi:predicted metal-binding membrane protein
MTARTVVGPRVLPITGALLIPVVGLAWWWTVGHAKAMSCMLDGLARAGQAMPFDAGPVHFTVMWAVMMTAMMLPGMIAIAWRYPVVSGIATAVGYVMVWTATAAVGYGVLIALNEVQQPEAWLNRSGGALVALAGVFQVSGWKRRSLAGYGMLDETPASADAFTVGLAHGLRCLASSWALMSALLVVGVMNVVWMAAIAAICLAEKIFTRRAGVAAVVGALLITIGAVVVAAPQTLNVIAER